MAEFEALGAGGTEAQFQQFLAYLFAQQSIGLVQPGVMAGLAVSQTSTASGSVQIAAGMGVAQDSVLNGTTPLMNNTTKTLDIFTANPMGGTPRNDIVVFDAATKTIVSVTGTPNAVPSDPTAPSTAFPLARLRHAASATTIPTARIDDLRVITNLAGVAKTYLSVTSGMVGKRVHRQDFTGGTTDASGFLTVTHTAGFTPTFVQVAGRTPGSSFAVFWGSDTYSGTQARLRFFRSDTAGAFASTATGAFTAIFWE